MQRIFFKKEEEDPLNQEHWLLYEFKRKAHLYVSDLPEKNDILSWLALMQHHGAPTRFIDFTESFYIACFFAVVDANCDSVVWVIDESWLRSIALGTASINSRRKYSFEQSLKDDQIFNLNCFSSDYLNKILVENKSISEGYDGVTSGALIVDPYKKSKRASVQQGVFIMPADIKKDLLGNIEGCIDMLPDEFFLDKRYIKIIQSMGEKVREDLKDKDPFNERNLKKRITKIIIPLDMRESVLDHLKRMNITYESLFPGIDGFSKSLRHTVLGG